MKTLTPSQSRAVAYLRKFIEGDLNKNPEYGDTITEWDVETTEGGTVIVRARTEMVKLPEGNLLRYMDAKWFLFFIGRGGKTTMAMGPKSFEQFNGKRTSFGFHVAI